MQPADPFAVNGSGEQTVDSLLMENAELEMQLDGLHRALQSRATIEQAKGVLMAFCWCTEAEAFTLLARLSQQRNVRVRALAETLVRLAGTGFEVADGTEVDRWLREQLATLGGTRRGRVPPRSGGPYRPDRPPRLGGRTGGRVP